MNLYRSAALCGLFAVPLVFAVDRTAHADRLDDAAPLGATQLGEITRAGEVRTIGLLVTEGSKRKLSILVKRGKGSNLEPTARLIDPTGNVLDIAALGGKVKSSAKSFKAKLVDVPTSGLWRLEVSGANDSLGLFQYKVVAKEGVKLKTSPIVPVGSPLDIEVEVGAESEMTIKASRSRGSVVIPDVQILGPNGLPVADAASLGGVNEKKGRTQLKKIRLPHFGTYTLRFTGRQGTGGQMSLNVVTKQSKVKGIVPTADAGDSFGVDPGVDAQLNGARSAPAPGGGSFSVTWTQVSGPAVVLSDPKSMVPTFKSPAVPASLGFELVANQGGVWSRTDFVSVEVGPRPIANAGRSQRADASSTVTLDGAGSLDRRGEGVSYHWRQLSGDPVQVTLDDAGSATPSFQAPAQAAVLHFGLVIDDGNARSDEDVVVVAIGDSAQAVADAGRTQVVSRMSTVHLCGLGSTAAAGSTPTFEWTQIAGTPVELNADDAFSPSFTAPRFASDLLFRLTVNGETATADTVQVNVRPLESNRPTRVTGNGSLVSDLPTVNLAASGAVDPDGDPVVIQWNQIAGPAGALGPVEGTTVAATTGGVSGAYQFALQAHDGRQYGAPDIVQVRTSNYAGLPIANAGANQSALPGVLVSLNGLASGSTTGSSPLTYQWAQVSGNDWFDVAAENAGFVPSDAAPKFTVPIDVSSLTPHRTITFQLIVNDGTGFSLPDYVTIAYSAFQLNGRPSVTVSASSFHPIPGTDLQLIATATDRDNNPLTYKWRRISGPSVVFFPSDTALMPKIFTPTAGVMVLELTADDGIEESAPGRLTIDINEVPTAVVTISPKSAEPGTTITVHGRASTDADNEPLTYTWSQVQGPAITFDTATEEFQFVAPDAQVQFRLSVNDGVQDSQAVIGTFSPQTDINVNPVANVASAAYGSTVQLQANADVEGVLYSWRQIRVGATANDPVVTLSDLEAENPSFTAPIPPNTKNGGFGQSPGVTLGLIARKGASESAEGTIRVPLHASFNTATASTVYSIISANCLSCHTGSSNFCGVGSGNNASGYGMNSATAFYNNTVGASSCNSKTKQRAVAATSPGSHSANSYLLDRLNGVGGIMPSTGGALTNREINIVSDWLDQGAKNN